MKLTPEEIIVLSLNNPCVSLYSFSHQLIREVIPLGDTCKLGSPGVFNLDNSSNILITGYNFQCVCSLCILYSGEFLHKFDKEGDQKGDFNKPCGILICPRGRIICT